MAITSLAMFSFPKHLRGNRIPPPMKLRAIEAQKKQSKQEEEPKTPQLKGFIINSLYSSKHIICFFYCYRFPQNHQTPIE